MSTVEIELTPDIASAPEYVQERFRELVAGGASPRMAEMFALRSAPRVKTDATYFADVGTLDKLYGSAPCNALEKLVEIARSHGYEPGINDVYDPGLARFAGDPQAFIPATGGRNHIRRVIESRGVNTIDGPVSVRDAYREPENPPECERLAPDLVEEAVEQYIAAYPALRFNTDRNELRERAKADHGYDDSKLTGELSNPIVHSPSVSMF